MKGLIQIDLAIMLCVCLAVCNVVYADDSHAGILVVKSRDIAFYTTALQGFVHGLKTRGYDDGSGNDIHVISLTGDPSADGQSVSSQMLRNYHLVLTLGTDATREVAANHPTTPCVFSMILDPVSLGVANSINQPGGDFTGTTLQVSPGKQLDALQQVDPAVKRIGLIYTDGDPTSLAFLSSANNDASRLGIVIVAKPIASGSGNGRQALQQMVGQVDAFWLIIDPASAGPQALRDTFDIATANHIPVLGTSSANVKEGALVALSANIQDLGDVDAEMSVPLLNNSALPSTTPIRGPRQTMLSINLDAAKAIGLTVPKSVLELADEVIDSSNGGGS